LARIPPLLNPLDAALLDNAHLSYFKVTKYGQVPILVRIMPLQQSLDAALLDNAQLSYYKVSK
jgi:hypothetical protein